MDNSVFGRVVTAVVTPFTADGGVDYGAAEGLMYHLAQHGSDAVVIAATTGEGVTLSPEERLDLFKLWRGRAPEGMKLLANTGTNDTAQSVELTRAATDLGMDGVMAVYPYYNKPNTEGQIRHFRTIAQATKLPVLLYNVPSRTGGKMSLEAVIELSGVSNIVAIKEASGDLDFVSAIAANAQDDFAIYSGDDSLTLPILAVGGVGVVSVVSHLVGERMQAMITAFHDGRVEEAARIHASLFGLCKAMFIAVNPIPVKTALALMGLIGEHFRLPLTPASTEVKNRLVSILNQHGLFPGIPGTEGRG